MKLKFHGRMWQEGIEMYLQKWSYLQILHRTARDEFSGGQSFSADAELVAYGLSQNIYIILANTKN